MRESCSIHGRRVGVYGFAGSEITLDEVRCSSGFLDAIKLQKKIPLIALVDATPNDGVHRKEGEPISTARFATSENQVGG